jgi:AraC-like DNA-binding protein
MVAIKVLKDDYLEDEDFRDRFHAEGQAVAMLSHPNIVSVYDVSTNEDADYIVMELIEGISLKQYIEKNLRKNLQVGDIAPAIGLSRTYLSRLFHQAEGITVQQYIQKEKCRHAAQMLQYTDYSISQIALYFSFSSQSYFGSCFQTWYGMTPNAYRKAHH